MTNPPESPSAKGGFQDERKTGYALTNGGAILFTIEVVANLLFVVKKGTGWVLEWFETQHKWFGAHHKWDLIHAEAVGR